MASRHVSHPDAIARLRRAEGHLRRVIAMLEEGAACLDIATQAHAVERAVANAKRALIHDHMDHCLDGGTADMGEFRALAKLL
jgi:DNA-binding FrmR family transcriptional regulator